MLPMPVGMMATAPSTAVAGARPVFVGNSANVNSSTLPGAKSVPLPATLTVGDLLIIAVLLRNDESNGTTDTPADWAKVTGSPFGGSSKLRWELLWKFADADDAGTTVTVTASGGTTVDRIMIRCLHYHADNGFAAAPIQGIGEVSGTATPQTHPSLTADEDNQLGVTVAGGSSNQAAFGAWSGGSGGTWTENFFQQSGAALANDCYYTVQSAPLTKSTAATGGSKVLSPSTFWTTVGFRLVPAMI